MVGVRALERRTGGKGRRVGDEGGADGVEPWRSIDVVEGLAPPHLVDVDAGM